MPRVKIALTTNVNIDFMKNSLIVVVVLALVALGGWYYMSTQKAPASNDTAQTVDQGASSPATGTPTGTVKEFTVTGSKFKFDPAVMSVKKGDTVKIHFVNADGFHDFVIDEFNVRTPQINGGQSADIQFVADKAGSFEYYCSVGNHRAMGMKGTLTVE